ncbi:MAG: M23 family metallopeptidase [Actinomycetota bacterium]
MNGDAEESQLLDSVLQADRDEIARLVAERAELDRTRRGVEDELDKGRVRLTQAAAAVEAAEQDVDAGTFAARIFAAGSEVAITGFVFPVGDPHDFIDSWGFPRAGGRSHEGADIFAPRGTPLFAVEDGVLVRVGNDRLGGTKLWLVGESGTHYYYAHLERYAVGVRDGARVEAGNVIGFVGDTGDAKGTPPHLHFQLHPGGGDPVNPFPLLSVVDELDREQRASDQR